MGLAETIIFYLLVGLSVATAVFLTERATPRRSAFRAGTAVVFWPLYLPILLAGRGPNETAPPSTPHEPCDEMATAIGQAEAELDAALGSLDGWAEDVLRHEQDRFKELRAAWRAQAERIREMDRLLSDVESDRPATLGGGAGQNVRRDGPPVEGGRPAGETHQHRWKSELARRKNVDRLRQVRRRAMEDLMGTLAWVRELVSMIHLAKFTGAPASRAAELVAQIAAAVEGVSAVTWQETTPTVPGDTPGQLTGEPTHEIA